MDAAYEMPGNGDHGNSARVYRGHGGNVHLAESQRRILKGDIDMRTIKGMKNIGTDYIWLRGSRQYIRRSVYQTPGGDGEATFWVIFPDTRR